VAELVQAEIRTLPPPASSTGLPAATIEEAPPPLRAAVEVVVRIGVLLVLIAWCFWITRPFIVAVLWGVILAVAVHPGYCRVRSRLGGREGPAAALLTVLALLLLIGPLTMLTTALVGNVADLATRLTEGRIVIPPPPTGIASWPFIGERLEQFWSLASLNLLEALGRIQPQLRALAGWLLSLAAGAGLGALNFLAAVVIAGVLLAYSRSGGELSRKVASRLVGERGPGLASLAEDTIRNVTRGVLGTALIQSTMAGIGFVVFGVPWAALLTLACFLLCVAQVGPALVLLGTVIYVFSTADTLTACIFLVWCTFVGLIDNVLRPVLMSRGSAVPLPVILAGVIGGLLAHGLIGLFVGPIVLALGYELFKAWLASPVAAPVGGGEVAGNPRLTST
jgi:predicted PurR-regulated permease PerM